jgi:hypothetical protein
MVFGVPCWCTTLLSVGQPAVQRHYAAGTRASEDRERASSTHSPIETRSWTMTAWKSLFQPISGLSMN